MKHDELRSIAHNIADSLASGCCLMISVFDVGVFQEAAQSEKGFLEVDFLAGAVTGGQVSAQLADAIKRFRAALPGLCAKHRIAADSFKEFTVRYYAAHDGGRFTVKVKDKRNQSSLTEYGGLPGQRVKLIDELGRLRPKPILRFREASG